MINDQQSLSNDRFAVPLEVQTAKVDIRIGIRALIHGLDLVHDCTNETDDLSAIADDLTSLASDLIALAANAHHAADKAAEAS